MYGKSFLISICIFCGLFVFHQECFGSISGQLTMTGPTQGYTYSKSSQVNVVTLLKYVSSTNGIWCLDTRLYANTVSSPAQALCSNQKTVYNNGSLSWTIPSYCFKSNVTKYYAVASLSSNKCETGYSSSYVLVNESSEIIARATHYFYRK